MDNINEDGYEDPSIVNGILMKALIDEMKEKASKMSHFQRFVGLKLVALMVTFYF